MLVYPRNLPGLTSDITRRPKHAVSIQQHQSGGEVRMSYWSEPLWEWDLSYELLRDGFRNGQSYDELKQLEGLFLACAGSLQGFSFFDPDDHCVTRQFIGTTDGVTSAFDLVRTYGSYNQADGYQGTEHIGLVDTTAQFNLYIDNAASAVAMSDPVYGYTLATAAPKQQQLVFDAAPPPGHAISIDMSYLFYCRFLADTVDFDKFMAQLWALKKVTLCSLRFGSGGSSLPSPYGAQAPGRSLAVTASPFQVLGTDGYIGITNNSGVALEIDMPAYPAANQVVKLKDEGGNALAFPWTIRNAPSGTVIDTIETNGGFLSLRWNGTAWYQIGAS